jgi:hypothetical protein
VREKPRGVSRKDRGPAPRRKEPRRRAPAAHLEVGMAIGSKASRCNMHSATRPRGRGERQAPVERRELAQPSRTLKVRRQKDLAMRARTTQSLGPPNVKLVRRGQATNASKNEEARVCAVDRASGELRERQSNPRRAPDYESPRRIPAHDPGPAPAGPGRSAQAVLGAPQWLGPPSTCVPPSMQNGQAHHDVGEASTPPSVGAETRV